MSIHTKYKIIVLGLNNQPIIVFDKIQIHLDDSIQIIKKKFLKEYTLKPISYEEIYMFSRILKTVPTESLFHSIADPVTKKINRDIFAQVLSNWNIDLDMMSVSESISYEEFAFLFGNRNTVEIEYKIPIDRKFISKNEERFSANPFDIIPGSSNIFVDKEENPLITLDNQVLLNHNEGKFIEDTIYVCLAEDVLEYCCQQNRWDDHTILKMYYSRMITAYEINNQQEWIENRQRMLRDTGKMLNESVFQMDKIVDLFYNVDEMDNTPIEYLKRGIKSISVSIVPTVTIGLPLESIFKRIHANETRPFIKFNPGFRRENMYRLYADKLTQKGEKVPFMKKNLILRLAKELGRKKIISFYIYDSVFEIYVDLENTGNVKIRGICKEDAAMNIEEIEQQFVEKANPILSTVNSYLSASGHSIQLFESLNRPNIQIGEVTYVWNTRVRLNSIQLNKLNLRPIFETYDIDAKLENDSGVELRFKRVDNYRDMDVQEIFITEIFKKTNDIVEINKLFREQFKLSEEEAMQKIARYLSDDFRGQDISDSPGFPVYMKIENSGGSIFKAQATVSKHFEYVNILNMYIESILRITQDKTKQYLKELKELNQFNEFNKKKREPDISIPVIKNVEIIEKLPLKISINLLEQELGIVNQDLEEVEEEEEEEEEPSIEFEYEEEDDEQEGGFETENINIDNDTFPVSKDFENIGYNFGGDDSDEEDNDDELYNERDLIGKNIDSQIGVLRRLQEKDPVLFNYKHTGANKGKFDTYTRACQAFRQPVILSEKEKAKLDKDSPDSYEHAMQYGTDPDKKNWYMCPRFWCLKTNMPISEKDARSGKCGEILPLGSTTITKGNYVYEFDRKGQYTPGFFKENDRHPQGYCLPCCFKKPWDNEGYTNRRAECMKKDEENAAALSNQDEADADADDKGPKSNANYIRNIQKFPLEPKRWGFLPVSIQRMLQIKSNMSNTSLNFNKKTMLRYGVEKSENKSFVACIADMYAAEKKINVPSIAEMCDILADAISIDIFIQCHNGSLPSIFQPKRFDYGDIDYAKYDTSTFIQSAIQEKMEEEHEDFINDTIASYETFQTFLRTSESIIDYTYLWDIISLPNPLLFHRGLNLAILEIPDNDATEHVEIVCPTAAYSSAIYDAKKETLILTKRHSDTNDEIIYFEPVYLYDKKQITRKFSSNTQIKPIQHILQVIRQFSKKKCAPLKSMPKEYTFQRNKPATEIRDICTKYNIDLLAQVLNFQGKIVAFLVKVPTVEFYLPCAPSAILPDVEQIMYIDDDRLWQNYVTTRDELFKLSALTSGELLCKPFVKIIEDELIVGVLTETNQFVMVNPPEENHAMDDLIELKDTNYIMADIDLANRRKMDTVRERTVKMIRLEKYFYQVFRTTLRILLQQTVNERSNIMKLIENLTYANYLEQLKLVELWLHKMMDSFVVFQKYDENVLMQLNQISDCFSGEPLKTQQYCIFKSNVRQLIIPERNLISGKMNQVLYFRRLADELLRYKRVRSMILEKHANIMQTDEYQLNTDEMILLDYMIADYLSKDLVPVMKIKDAHISYDFANPYKTTKYSNEVKLVDQLREKVSQEKIIEENLLEQPQLELEEKLMNEKSAEKVPGEISEDQLKLECVKETNAVVGNSKNVWKQYFPKNVRELFLNPFTNCTYYPILIIYKQINDGKIITIGELKKILTRTYNEYLKYEKKILYILSLQGKRDMMEKVTKKQAILEEIIMSDMYPLSNLDYWVLCKVLKLPVILFTSMKSIKNLLNGKSWIQLGESASFKHLEYYFIRAPTETFSKTGVNEIHGYSMIVPGIPMEEMQDFQEEYMI